jgi:DNA repair protein RadC
MVLYLNNSNTPLGVYKASKGGIKGTTVDVRLIMAMALKSIATCIIISHNHPSGNLFELRKTRSSSEKTIKVFHSGI